MGSTNLIAFVTWMRRNKRVQKLQVNVDCKYMLKVETVEPYDKVEVGEHHSVWQCAL